MQFGKILKYKLLKIEYFLRMNIGKDKYGYQFFSLHLVPVSSVRSEYLLKQYYGNHNIHKFANFYFFINEVQYD